MLVDGNVPILMCAVGTQYCVPTACLYFPMNLILSIFCSMEHEKSVSLKDVIDSIVLLFFTQHLLNFTFPMVAFSNQFNQY